MASNSACASRERSRSAPKCCSQRALQRPRPPLRRCRRAAHRRSQGPLRDPARTHNLPRHGVSRMQSGDPLVNKAATKSIVAQDFDPRKGTNPAINNLLPEYEFDQRVSWLSTVPLQPSCQPKPRQLSRTRPGPAQNAPSPALTRTTQSSTGPSDLTVPVAKPRGFPILLGRAVDPTHDARFRVVLNTIAGILHYPPQSRICPLSKVSNNCASTSSTQPSVRRSTKLKEINSTVRSPSSNRTPLICVNCWQAMLTAIGTLPGGYYGLSNKQF